MAKKTAQKTTKHTQKSPRAERSGQLISAPKLSLSERELIAEYFAHHPLAKKPMGGA